MRDKTSLQFNFILVKEDDGDFVERDEDAIDRVLDAFIGAVEKENWCAGGGVCNPPPEERICQRCGGVGIKDPIPAESKCPTCDGSGEVDPNAMSREEFEELYDSSRSSKDRAAVS